MKSVLHDQGDLLIRSRPTRGAWIEILIIPIIPTEVVSRPTRGAWIEMLAPSIVYTDNQVAPHTGRVD